MLPSAQREAQEAEGLKDMLRDRVEKACSAAGFWNASGDTKGIFLNPNKSTLQTL